MDKKQTLNIVGKYVTAVKKKYDLKKALLFGSYARGTNYNDSDIDIALIFNNVSDIIDLQIELMRLRRPIDLRIEPHPFNEKEFNISNPIVKEIMLYGIEVQR